MMFERFTGSARNVVVQAQEAARRLGHNYIGCEHLLLAAATAGEPAGAVLRDRGVTPERIEATILRIIGRDHAVDPLGGLDREALAAIGIDLDVVRARLVAAFGPDALDRAIHAHRQARQPRRGSRRSIRPVWGKGPVAHLMRRRRSRRVHHGVPPSPELRAMASRSADPAIRGHIPFTPRAKKSLELSLRESKALHDNYIGVHHLILALLAMKDGMSPTILSALDVSGESLRADILARYRKAS
jgi:ATP-dependent Clp protease ATP-binding subunit ClpA